MRYQLLITGLLVLALGSTDCTKKAGVPKNTHDVVSQSHGSHGIVVWAVDDGIRVKQNDINHWSRNDTGNTVWRNGRVVLAGARNEVVAFQLIIATDSAVSGLDVRLDRLTDGTNFIRNRSDDPLQYVGRNIELFVEQYLQITRQLHKGRVGSDTDTSAYMGWVPDALVPIEADSGDYANGQGGAPFHIAANNTQGVWIDIYIPKSSPAGDYHGQVVVSKGGVDMQSIPVNLTVYNITLSDSTHLHNSFFGSYSNVVAHGLPPENYDGTFSAEYISLIHKYKLMMHRHRQNLTHVMRYENFAGGKRKTKFYGDYLTGAGYTAARGYAGPGTGVGDNMYLIGQFAMPHHPERMSFETNTQEGFWTSANLWEQWFITNAPKAWRFFYSCDEPLNFNARYLPTTVQQLHWMHNNPGVGKSLKVLVTTHLYTKPFPEPPLEPLNIDLVAEGMDAFLSCGPAGPWFGYNVESGWDGHPGGSPVYTAEKVRALPAPAGGHRLAGVYNGQRPDYGGIPYLDLPPTEMRVNPWILFKYDVDMYMLWETAFWAERRYPGARWPEDTQNPWAAADAHGASWLYSGEERLIPGNASSTYFPRDDRKYRGPIASIRMKMYRRGIQDYEYLYMADRVNPTAVTAIVDTIVPAAFNDARQWKRYNPVGRVESVGAVFGDGVVRTYPIYKEDNHSFELARKQLASILNNRKIPSDDKMVAR